MAGTLAGGKAAAATNKQKYGEDFYAKIGAKGGKLGKTGGFYAAVCKGCDWNLDPHKIALCAGAKGGTISRRTKKY
jgi:general stress protein YciG